MAEFIGYGKTLRIDSDVVITEKIDGTNALIYVSPDGAVWAGGRRRWLTPADDNHGFAQWVKDNEDTLRKDLGPGYHRGEWFGGKIQRGYGLRIPQLALFDVDRYLPKLSPMWDATAAGFVTANLRIVPILSRGPFSFDTIERVERSLKRGSYIYTDDETVFQRPEGFIVRFKDGHVLKKVIDK